MAQPGGEPPSRTTKRCAMGQYTSIGNRGLIRHNRL